MDLSNLSAPHGANRDRKRLGRGQGSGQGKTAGKGHKGQKARAGGGVRAGFEGGQTPLHRRLPKRGFTNIHATSVEIVNLRDLDRVFDDGAVIDLAALHQGGLIHGRYLEAADGSSQFVPKADKVKVLGEGDLAKKFTVTAHLFSKSAAEKIQAAGGSVEVIA